MKNIKEQDERVVAQARKINSEAFSLLFYALIISIIVQQFILKAPFEQYACEFYCFFGASLYIVVRKLTVGINVFGGRNPAKIMLTTGIVTGCTVTLVNGILNYVRNADTYKDNLGMFALTLLVTFVSAMASSFAVMLLIQFINGRKQRQIQQKLDAEEQDN